MDFLIAQNILSLNLPEFLNFILIYLAEFVIIIVFLLVAAFVTMAAEQKFYSALSSAKISFTAGLLNTFRIIARYIKLFFKENIVPDKADKAGFILAPVFVLAPVIFVWTIIPFNTDFCVCKSDGGILFFPAMLLIPFFGMMLGGWASNNKFSLIGGMRCCLGLISSEIPVLLSVMSVVILSGTLSLQQTVISQAKYDIFSWYIFPSFLGFLIFFISGLALMNRTPFDFSEYDGESEYTAEYSGIFYAVFNLAEYALLFIICVFASTLFLGGFLSPFGIYVADFFSNNGLYYLILTTEQIFWLLAKTTVLILLIFWIKMAVPRLKPDILASFSWKYLIPLSVINLLIVSVIKLMFGGIYV